MTSETNPVTPAATTTEAPAQTTTAPAAPAAPVAPATTNSAAETTQSGQAGAAQATTSTQDAAKSEAGTEQSESKSAAGEQPAVPEKYDLKLPEGSLLQAKAIEEVAALAKEQKLSNEEAQALIEQRHKAVADYDADQQKLMTETVDGWAKQVSEDSEIGGQAHRQNVELAHRVAKRFGSSEFSKVLNESGLGNHPEFVRTFLRIGKAMSEDQLVITDSDLSAADESPASVLYGKSKK